jgi:hypothetical protein
LKNQLVLSFFVQLISNAVMLTLASSAVHTTCYRAEAPAAKFTKKFVIIQIKLYRFSAENSMARQFPVVMLWQSVSKLGDGHL